jgi:hypothetical protein
MYFEGVVPTYDGDVTPFDKICALLRKKRSKDMKKISMTLKLRML